MGVGGEKGRAVRGNERERGWWGGDRSLTDRGSERMTAVKREKDVVCWLLEVPATC